MDPRMFGWKRSAMAGLVLASVMAACGDEPFPTTPNDPVVTAGDERPRPVIYLYDNLPSPGTLVVQVGDLVEWKNSGANNHSVSSYGTPDEWEDTLLEPGQSFLHAFESPGDYAYICIVHGEVGDVQVRERSMDMDMGDMDYEP